MNAWPYCNHFQGWSVTCGECSMEWARRWRRQWKLAAETYRYLEGVR